MTKKCDYCNETKKTIKFGHLNICSSCFRLEVMENKGFAEFYGGSRDEC